MKTEPNSLSHSFFFALDDDEDEDKNSALTLDSLWRRGGVRSARVLDLAALVTARRPSCKELGREGEIKDRAIRSFGSFLHSMF